MGLLRLWFCLLVAVVLTLFLMPLQFLAIHFNWSLAHILPMVWHRTLLKAIGTRVIIHGELPKLRPLFVTSNHISWTDILVLGSAMPVSFIAKGEVRTWPGINLLANLQRTVFVDRARWTKTSEQVDTIAMRLAQNDVMVLFAEGTTGTGHSILPFKSALFGAAHKAMIHTQLEEVTILPIALAYTGLHGLPLGRFHQAKVAWPGDIPLLPHLKQFVISGAYDVHVSIGEPIAMSRDDNRKVITNTVEKEVRKLFATAMRTR